MTVYVATWNQFGMMDAKGIAMPLILLIAALVVLRFFEVWRFANLSWWWIVALMAFAFVWFEFIEKMLGWDKKKLHRDEEKRRRQRVEAHLNKRK